MKKPNKNILREISDYTAIILGALLSGVGFNWFIIPNHISPGGVSGVATIIHYLVPAIPVGLMIIAINIPLFLISWRELGRGFGIKSLVGTLALSLATDYIKIPALVDDPLLAGVFGGVMYGAGLGIVLRNNGSTGGTDILAKLIFKRFPARSLGTYILIFDFVIIAASGIANKSVQVALYSLIAVFVSTKTIDLLQDGVSSAKAYYIITHRGEEISRRINQEMKRGVTVIDTVGAYTGAHVQMLLCLIVRSETAQLRRIVKQEDAKAFLFIVDAREVIGNGFGPDERKTLLYDPKNFE